MDFSDIHFQKDTTREGEWYFLLGRPTAISWNPLVIRWSYVNGPEFPERWYKPIDRGILHPSTRISGPAISFDEFASLLVLGK